MNIIYQHFLPKDIILPESNSKDIKVPHTAVITMITPKIYMYLDVISLLPIPYILALCDYKQFTYFYVFFLPHIVQFTLEMNRINKYFDQLYLLKNIVTRRLIWSYFIYIVTIHVAACCFTIVALNIVNKELKRTWLVADNLIEITNNTIIYNQPVSIIYLRSIYWAIVSMVTTGFGDIAAITVPESVIAAFFFFCGYIGVVILIALMNYMVSVSSSSRDSYLRKMDEINEYMSYRKLPTNLQFRIRSFYQYMWELTKGINVSEFISNLPSSYKTQVSGMQTRNTLTKLIYFKDCDVALVNALVLALEQHVYSPGDDIITVGKINKNLYLLTRGEAEMISNKNTVVKIMSVDKENIYGDLDIFESHEANSTIRAKSFCEVHILSYESFQKVKSMYLSGDKINMMKEMYLKMEKQQKKLTKLLGSGADSDTKNHYIGYMSIFLPRSLFRMYWGILLLIMTVWTILIVPIRISYFYSNQYSTFFKTASAIDYIGDILFFLDIVFRYHFFAFEENGITICNKSLIHQRYLSDKLGFGLDLISAIPFYLIAYTFSGNYKSFFLILKLTKYYRLVDYTLSFSEFLENKRLTINNNLKQIIEMMSLLLVVSHYMSCIWYFLGNYIKYNDNSSINWIDNDNNNPMYSLNHSEWYNISGYVRSLFMVLLSITTVGYSDIVPVAVKETVYTSIIILIGGVFYPAVVGAVATFSEKIGGASKDFMRKNTNLRRYMEKINLPESLRNKIIQYYDYIWTRQHGVDELKILRDLPNIMRSDTTKNVLGDTLVSIPFFKAIDQEILKGFYACIEPNTFLPDEYILTYDEIGNGIYMIKYGMASVESPSLSSVIKARKLDYVGSAKFSVFTSEKLSESDFEENSENSLEELVENEVEDDEYTIYKILYQGSYCGSSSLINMKSPVNIRSMTFCDCYLLSKDSVMKVLSDNHDIQKSFIGEVKDNCNKIVAMYETIETNKKRTGAGRFLGKTVTFSHRELTPTSFYHPDSIKKRYWSLLMFIITIYNIFFIPIRLIILTNVSVNFYIMDWIFDIFLIMDFTFNLHKFAFMYEGQIISNSDEILKHRIREYTFYTDLISIIPWDILLIFILQSRIETQTLFSVVVPALRLTKLLNCFHYKEYAFSLSRLLEEYPSIPEYFGTVIRLLINVAIVSHVFAVGFLFLGTFGTGLSYPVKECSKLYNEFDPPLPDNHGMNKYGECLYKDKWIQKQIEIRHLPAGGGSDSLQYLRSFYWSISTLICVVIGEIGPVNNAETLYMVIAIIVGIVINSGIIGDIASLVSNLQGEEAIYSSKLEIMENYQINHKLSDALISKMNNYMEYVRESKGGSVNKEIVDGLPDSLRNEIVILRGFDMLKTCPIFKGIDKSFVRELSLKLKLCLFSPDELIYSYDDKVTKMYFILNGSVGLYESVITLRDNKFANLLSIGHFFGEMYAFCRARVTEIAKSIDYTEALSLDEYDISTTIISFDADLEILFQNLAKLDTFYAPSAKSLRPKVSFHYKIEDNLEICVNMTYKSFFHIPPSSNFRLLWEAFGYISMIYVIVFVPFFSGYHDPVLIHSFKAYWYFFIFDGLFEIYFIIDSILRMNFFSYMNNGFLQSERSIIRQNYVKTQLLFDIFAFFPLEIFATIDISYYPHLRALHLLVIFKYGKYYERLKEVLTNISKKITPAIISILNIFALMLLFVHFCACSHFIIHRYIVKNESITWAIADGLSTFDPVSGRNNIKNSEVKFISIYLRSFYYSMNVICTIGYGDIQPYSNVEIVFNIFMELFGAAFQAALIGIITAYLVNNDSIGVVSYKENMQNLIDFMKFRQIPDNLMKSILNFYSKLWERTKESSPPKVLLDLSENIQKEVSYYIYGSSIRQINDLYVLPKNVQEMISMKLRPFICDANEFIYKVGDIPDEIYFLLSGKVILFSKDVNDKMEKTSGETFGMEETICYSTGRVRNAKSELCCDIIWIHKNDLIDILKLQPRMEEFTIFSPLTLEINNFEDLLTINYNKSFDQCTPVELLAIRRNKRILSIVGNKSLLSSKRFSNVNANDLTSSIHIANPEAKSRRKSSLVSSLNPANSFNRSPLNRDSFEKNTIGSLLKKESTLAYKTRTSTKLANNSKQKYEKIKSKNPINRQNIQLLPISVELLKDDDLDQVTKKTRINIKSVETLFSDLGSQSSNEDVLSSQGLNESAFHPPNIQFDEVLVYKVLMNTVSDACDGIIEEAISKCVDESFKLYTGVFELLIDEITNDVVIEYVREEMEFDQIANLLSKYYFDQLIDQSIDVCNLRLYTRSRVHKVDGKYKLNIDKKLVDLKNQDIDELKYKSDNYFNAAIKNNEIEKEF